MEFYEDPNCCAPAPEPAPVEAYEPAPLPPLEPPVYEAPAPEIFPDAPAAAPVADVPAAPAVPVTPVAEVPLPAFVPETHQPVADAPLNSGTLLGPSTVGGSADTGTWIGGAPDLSASGYVGGAPDLSAGGYVGGTPDLGGSTVIGGSMPDLGGGVEYNGTPVAAPFEMPLAPGPFSAVAQNIFNANNAVLVDGLLRDSASTATPFPHTPGSDTDRDGVLSEHDANLRGPFPS